MSGIPLISGIKARVQPRLALAEARLDAENIRAMWLLMLSLGLFLALAMWAGFGDYHAGFLLLNQQMTGADFFWQWMTRFGDQGLLIALCTVLAIRRPEVFWALMVAAIFGILYARGLKPLFDAVRPPGVLPLDSFHLIGSGYSRYSFPSGHTLTIFTAVGVVAAFARSWSLRAVLLAFAVVVGLSRVAVGVHWPMDVLGGAAGGLLSAWLGVWLSQCWRAGLGFKVYLGLVVLALAHATSLWFSDGGYPDSRWLAWPVALGIWVYTVNALRPLPPQVSS